MDRGRLCKCLSIVISGIIAMTGLPCKVLADVINAPTYYSVQSDLNYEITTNITSSWINHESIDLVLTNTGSETIHNWYLTFNTPYNIDNIWNGALYETDGNGTYTITSNGWNQDIHSGESITVGITFSSDTEEDLSINPEWYLLNTQETVVDASQYTLEYAEYSAWETGFTGQLTLASQIDCQHWELSLASNREITAVSSAVLISEGENNYAITHDENNMRLFAGTAYNFGIQGVNTEDPLELSNVELTAVDLAYHLTYDADVNGIPDYLEFIGGGNIIDPTPTPTPVPTDTPTITPTEEPTGTPTTEPTGTETPTPTPIIDYEADRDLDGLPDFIEEQIGTDPLKIDTDDDGLSDYIEVMIGYAPVNPDSDGNGITDGNEDYDIDGISNVQELLNGTNIVMDDTDGDYLIDGNELNVYGTDPLTPDTDGDGIKDGDEVAIGKNPSDSSDGATRIPQTLTQIINNPVDTAITTVDVSMSVANRIDRVVDVEDYYNIDVYSTGVYGRIGSPLNFKCDEEFDTATVVIHYDESALGEVTEENLGVLWYDEETGFYIIQDQAIIDTSNNTVTLVLDHFSTYVLVDLNRWNNSQISPMVSTTSSIRTITWRTNGVYYADPVIETNSQGQLVIVGWANQTASPERYENTAWSNYLESHPNDVRVGTVNMRYIRDSWGGLSYIYTWNVYTTDTTDIDNDQDGVPDYWEINGIYPLNREINEDGTPVLYTSSVDVNEGYDSDDDNLSDLREYGTIYIVSMDSENGSYSVISISANGQENISTDTKVYLRICAFVEPVLDPGEMIAVCDLYSNPNDRDTDEDYYIDSVDSRPKTCGLLTIGLGGSGFNITEHDDDGYIHIINPPSNRGYGGCQSWFSEDAIFNTNLHISDTGCGLIATNDVMLYLNNGISNYEWSEYHDVVLSTYYEFMDSQTIMNLSLPNSFAISPIFVQEYFLHNGHMSIMYTINTLNEDYLYDTIEASLYDNRPVILLEDDRLLEYTNVLWGENSVIQRNGFPLYTVNDLRSNDYACFDDMITEYTMPMIFHYVTITGILIDDNAQLLQDRIYLRVQSWGEDYYIKYSDFVVYNLNSVTRNGVIITVN